MSAFRADHLENLRPFGRPGHLRFSFVVWVRTMPVSVSEKIAERAAKNQSTFRDANERIEQAAERLEDLDPVPFICECPQRDCTELVRLFLADYEAIREHGERFFAAPGHEVCEVDGVEVARLLERRDGFSVMEKVGEAGQVARQQDPRQGDSQADG